MVVKKKKAAAPLKVMIKCNWSGARIPVPQSVTPSSTLQQIIDAIANSLPPLFTKPSEWNDPQPSLVYMRTSVLKRDWAITKIGDFCDGGSILLTLTLPKEDNASSVAAIPPAATDEVEPMDIDQSMNSTENILNATSALQGTHEAVKYILNSNFDSDSQECLSTVLKMVDNLLSKSDAKFRSIRLTNATIERKIISKKGGLELLFALGFDYEQKVAFDFDNSSNVQHKSEMIVLLTADKEDRDLLLRARGDLSQALKNELNVEKVPQVPKVKPFPTMASGGAQATFDPFKSSSYNTQAAAVGAPNPNSIVPDGSSSKTSTERKLEILQQKQQRLEQKIQTLQDREIVALLPGEIGPIISLDAPGDDILDGKGDTALIAGLAKKKMEDRKKREEGGFQTKSMRELEKMKKAKVYSHAQLKIFFPDGVRVEAKFLPSESIQIVKDIVISTFLPEYAMMAFDLYISPPRRVLDCKKSLRHEGLVPAAKIHVSWKSPPPKASPGFCIQPHYFQASSSRNSATAFPDAVALEESKKDMDKKMPAKVSGKSGKSSREEELMNRMLGKRKGLGFGKKSSSTDGKSTGTGNPKWFKG